jgi:iron complex transport system ATP-binding protein
MSAALLEARQLTLAAGDRTLCESLDLDIRAGECWAIVGPNGAGKTTLLRTLAGLAAPRQGSVRYSGRDLAELGARERARHRALLPQDSLDAFPSTVIESVLIGRHPHVSRFGWESAADVALANEALARFGLDGFAQRDVRTLSGGERRRVALASLLVQQAPLTLLDEPSTHLDLAHQVAALEVFVALARERGHALVMALHDLHLALRFCDRAVTIGGGRARAGAAGELLEAATLSALFERELVELRSDSLRTFVPR